MAVIVVADEEDSSRRANNSTYSNNTDYSNTFVSFLDGYTGGTPGNRKYSVSSIVLQTAGGCGGGGSVGQRYMAVPQANRIRTQSRSPSMARSFKKTRVTDGPMWRKRPLTTLNSMARRFRPRAQQFQ